MSILKAVGNFLFGKDPDIFDNQGHVVHKFSDEKWRQWDNRLKANPEYDWHQHSAKERAFMTEPATPPKKP